MLNSEISDGQMLAIFIIVGALMLLLLAMGLWLAVVYGRKRERELVLKEIQEASLKSVARPSSNGVKTPPANE